MSGDNAKRVEIEVIGGMCRLQFEAGHSTGKEPDTQPGVAFMLVADAPSFPRDGKHYSGSGVIGRSDAARLRDLLDRFLSECPPADAPGMVKSWLGYEEENTD